MMSGSDFQYDVFISYSHKDTDWVRGWLLPHLESFGVTVCIDYRDFEPGAPSVIEMERAVLSSRKTLLVITSSYVESEWTEFESVMVQTLDPAARERRAIPLLLEKRNLPLRLGTLTYLNFYNTEIIDEQLNRLVQAVKSENLKATDARILLIENEDSWIKIAKAVLADYIVDEVRTSSEGIRRLSSGNHYDLVLSNLNLLTDVEDASGQEVLEYIRDNCPSVPRVVITGHSVRGPIYSTLFEGYQITEFITKSAYNVPELRQLVRRILSPMLSGAKEIQARKNEVLRDLRKKYDQSVVRINEGLIALDAYEVRLRREVGQTQAEELTRPDKEFLKQKVLLFKNKYEDLTSRILLADSIDSLDKINVELCNEW